MTEQWATLSMLCNAIPASACQVSGAASGGGTASHLRTQWPLCRYRPQATLAVSNARVAKLCRERSEQ